MLRRSKISSSGLRSFPLCWYRHTFLCAWTFLCLPSPTTVLFYWICPFPSPPPRSCFIESAQSQKTPLASQSFASVPSVYSPWYEKEVLVHSLLFSVAQKLVVLLPSLENPFPRWLLHVSLDLETPYSLVDEGLSWCTVFLSSAASLCLS